MIAGVFVDVSNLYYCVSKKYPGRKMNYENYLNKIKEKNEIYRAFAYGTQVDDEALSFIECLRIYGFETRFKQPRKYSTWDVGITIDIMKIIDKLDLVIIGSSSRELVPLIEMISSKGVQSSVFACGIPSELKQASDFWCEITEDLLTREKENGSGSV